MRRLLGPRIGRSILSGKNYPPSDVWVELEAEIAFDSRPVLPHIQKPVLLIAGDRDRFFPWELVEETVRLIPDCTLVRYEGHGHMKAAASKRVAHDVLAFVDGSRRWFSSNPVEVGGGGLSSRSVQERDAALRRDHAQ